MAKSVSAPMAMTIFWIFRDISCSSTYLPLIVLFVCLLPARSHSVVCGPSRCSGKNSRRVGSFNKSQVLLFVASHINHILGSSNIWLLLFTFLSLSLTHSLASTRVNSFIMQWTNKQFFSYLMTDRKRLLGIVLFGAWNSRWWHNVSGR